MEQHSYKKAPSSDSSFRRTPLRLPRCEDPSGLVGDQCQGNEGKNGCQCLRNSSDDGLFLSGLTT